MEGKTCLKFREIKLGEYMDFNDTKQEAEFRKKCFDWLSENAKLKQVCKMEKQLVLKGIGRRDRGTRGKHLVTGSAKG